ncbi:MAG: hypothetical protein HOU81_07205 [Hamadaea sp.]|uniref:DUF6923 family protein n=1 Tax=Hamadaea sp. TaxID=2024425 RepID=UPI00181E6514|nr:GEVED domain-containing protein [Hamadaea sp.]NUR70591.1 hypothetical protein [Hamadaea sp.]NUT19280.1 hypothetical protein [Hamadaea sp.]
MAAGSSTAAYAAPIAAPRALPAPPAATDAWATCPNYAYMVTLPEGSGRSTFNRYDISTAKLIPIKQFDFVVNAIGYSKTQNLIWGVHSVDNAPDKLVRFGEQGELVEVGVPQDSSGTALTGFEALAGTVDGDKYIVHTRTPANHLMAIDVKPGSPTFGQVLTDVTLSRTSPGRAYLNVGDWDVYDQDGLLYAVELDSNFRKLVKVDPASGQVTDVATVTADLPDSANYGAAFVEDGSGNFYVGANDVKSGGSPTGQSQTFMMRTGFTPPLTTAYGKGAALRVNDGADCLLATDFGDAPDSYGTLDNSGGPAHVLSSYLHHGKKLRIGANIDADLDGFGNADATTDDSNVPQLNDDDGVPAGTKIVSTKPKLTVKITNTTGLAALLAGWLDVNQNGKFDDAERAMVSLSSSATSATLTWKAFSLPSASVKTFLRLRLYEAGRTEVATGRLSAGRTEAGPKPGGWVDGGEVEDHEVTLVPGPAARPVTAVAGSSTDDPADATDDSATGSDSGGLASTGFVLRPYLLMGVGMVLLGLVILILALIVGPKKVRRRV